MPTLGQQFQQQDNQHQQRSQQQHQDRSRSNTTGSTPFLDYASASSPAAHLQRRPAASSRPSRAPYSPLQSVAGPSSSPVSKAFPPTSVDADKWAGQGWSPLEHLIRQGKGEQQQRQGPRPPLRTGKSQIFEKATALSRSTSVRRRPTEVELDPELDDDGERDWDSRSINLLQGPRSDPAADPSTIRMDGRSHFDDGSINELNAPLSPDERPADSLLLGNAFRSSIASLASLNTITDQNQGQAFESYFPSSGFHLNRSDSVNTVRTAEFDEGGRWGRAWADRADDEESLYGGSEYGSGEQSDDPKDLISPNAGQGNRGLDALRNLLDGQSLDGLTLNDASGTKATLRSTPAIASQAVAQEPMPFARDPKQSSFAAPTAHPSNTNVRERVVSVVPSIFEGDLEAESRPVSVASVPDSQGHADDRSDAGSARVFVWPPTPSASEDGHGIYERYGQSHEADAASVHEWEAVTDDGSSDAGTASKRSTLIGSSPIQAQPSAQDSVALPATLSSALANGTFQGQNSSQASLGRVRQSSKDGKQHGHPAGRPPPPPPPPAARYEESGPSRFDLPIGKARAAAIAAADGRESIVSDLDVETLRLDGSSRRDSSSTINSLASGFSNAAPGVYEHRRQAPSLPGSPLRSQSGWSAAQQSQPARATPQRSFSLETTTSSNGARSTPLTSNCSHGPEQYARPRDKPPHHVDQPTPMQRSAVSNASAERGGPLGSPKLNSQASQQSFATARSQLSSTNIHQQPSTRHAIGQDTKTGPSAAENYLSQGISYHEQGDLSRSAYYFERSAKVDGGCVVGMCMWGMTLREGWGARKDPRKGFEWIQRAAAKAGEMMQNNHYQRTDADLKAVRSELKLSVYELGKCYCYGWGVKMDKKMGLEYFEISAKLGDSDAAAEAGALYASGKGCKKDLKKAAKYYRMAAAQGYDLIGLSWVWKPKFDD